jgi:NADH-quinone oxidoreductase subunit F
MLQTNNMHDLEDRLKGISADYEENLKNVKRRVIICAGTGCVANGSLEVYEEFKKEISATDLKVLVRLRKEEMPEEGGVHMSISGCQGFCQMGPLVTIEPDGIMYNKVKTSDVKEIVEKTLKENAVVSRLLYKDPKTNAECRGPSEIEFYTRQKRYVLEPCGKFDPTDINEYIHAGGYLSALRAYTEMTPDEICKEVEASGLRGRGGGGFPTGKKWQFTRVEKDKKKYLICNADEGDPGAFMDRSIMEGNPHSVIEGMMIAARAFGASEGYFYVRLEYPLAVERIRKALEEASKCGLLGDNIFQSGNDLYLHVMEGAGAFVCGEETALMASIEGKRGMPNAKPPFPAQCGLWGHPTVINNVETLATIPLIIRDTSAEYHKKGTKSSPGTKTFALTGHVANTGLIEVPFGITMREIIYDIGGGVIDDFGVADPEGFKAVQIGGPSGGCLNKEHLDMPLDFDSLQSVGAMVGSGGLVVMNRNTCMVQMARFFMQFTQNESCGKCTTCREGTKQMLDLLDKIIEGRATLETLKLLEDIAVTVKEGSLCGLGKTAANPVLSALRYFREEVEEHVTNKKCKAGRCKSMVNPRIDPELCTGCTACSRKCPVNAIVGERKKPHFINLDLCTRCGACLRSCKKFRAIIFE